MSAGYLSLTDADREEMLAAIGVSSVDELFEQVPPGVRLDRALDLPPALGEVDLVRHVEELASRNVHTGAELSFLGAGIYDHYVPAVADVVLSRGDCFHSWEYRKAPKRKGGRVYVEVRPSGEVTFHEGYVTAKEAQRLEKGEPLESVSKPPRSEVNGPLQGYIDLHRHAACRAALTGHPGVALRLMVAHAIAGSPLWNVRLGDEVLIQANAFMAAVEAIADVGARPIPIDVQERDLGPDVEQMAARVTPRTRAILVVHLYGHPVDLPPIVGLAAAQSLRLIEDCSHAHGASFDGRKVGELVTKGESLATVHVGDRARFEAALPRLKAAFEVAEEAPPPRPLIHTILDA